MKPTSHHRQYKEHGPLGDLLIKACRPDDKGVRSIPTLARQLNLAPMSIYKWIRNVKIPPDRAVEVVANSQGRVKLEEFHPYVYK